MGIIQSHYKNRAERKEGGEAGGRWGGESGRRSELLRICTGSSSSSRAEEQQRRPGRAEGLGCRKEGGMRTAGAAMGDSTQGRETTEDERTRAAEEA